MELGDRGLALGWPLSHFGVSLELGGPQGQSQSSPGAQEPPLPPQLTGLSHFLVRKSSPNPPVKGAHGHQVDAVVSLCVTLSHLL